MDAPFYKGQEVVAVMQMEFKGNIIIKKGADYVVEDIGQCGCGLWMVRVGVNLKSFIKMSRCMNCGMEDNEMQNAWLSAKGFAPKIYRSHFSFEDAINLVSKPEKIKL